MTTAAETSVVGDDSGAPATAGGGGRSPAVERLPEVVVKNEREQRLWDKTKFRSSPQPLKRYTDNKEREKETTQLQKKQSNDTEKKERQHDTVFRHADNHCRCRREMMHLFFSVSPVCQKSSHHSSYQCSSLLGSKELD
ncbi:hypothetical protein LINGRAHAP2_LOCUS18054 [Linum grandiflorum]